MLEQASPANPVDRNLERIKTLQPMDLNGAIDASLDLSGAVAVGDYLILGADEGHRLQVLRSAKEGRRWRLKKQLPLAKQDQETDIEAITYGDGYLYVVGSHSWRRKRLKPELPVAKNRERLLQVEQQESRGRLYRVAFDPTTGKLGRKQRIDLSKRLRRDPLLGLFWGIPGKENGIDIEGIAFRDGLLYLGFRGPVLRDNLVPVMRLTFDQPKRYELNFVCLDGQGIRDMVALDEGFLILSGPVNDATAPFCLWWWDGNDQIPGKDRAASPTHLLGAVSTPGGAKAEGLALLQQDPTQATILVIYETDTAAQAVSMRVDLSALGI
ncbi:MAG: DUF3616 domain-containing protein [Sedimenticolaceae bacterium]